MLLEPRVKSVIFTNIRRRENFQFFATIYARFLR